MNQLQDEPSQAVPRGPTFTLTVMFIISLVASVMGAAAYYLARSIDTGKQLQFAFIMFTLTAPTLLIVLVNSLVRIVHWISRRRV